MTEKFDVVIIGGGASGLFLASQLAGGLSVALLECGDRVGKKLLATGNGKCNLTNLDIDIAHYNNPKAVEGILGRFDAQDTVATFERMGLVTKVVDKRVYPLSECASTVLDVLRRAVTQNGTHIFTSHVVNSIETLNGKFTVSGKRSIADKSEQFKIIADNVVLATGSPATFGRDSTSLYMSLGHTSRPMLPSLVPIRTEKEPIKGLQGVRVKAGVRLGTRYEEGEVLFKDFGVSGIAVFNLSGEIARGRAHSGDVLSIDFMPEYSRKEAEDMLSRRDSGMTVGELLVGTFHSRLQERIIHMAGCRTDDKAVSKISALADGIKDFKLTVEGLGDASLAQVMSGGLKTDEFDENLMSLKVRGAYAMGEALDVDGDCGGYNLQWAWSSAKAVALSIAKNLIK